MAGEQCRQGGVAFEGDRRLVGQRAPRQRRIVHRQRQLAPGPFAVGFRDPELDAHHFGFGLGTQHVGLIDQPGVEQLPGDVFGLFGIGDESAGQRHLGLGPAHLDRAQAHAVGEVGTGCLRRRRGLLYRVGQGGAVEPQPAAEHDRLLEANRVLGPPRSAAAAQVLGRVVDARIGPQPGLTSAAFRALHGRRGRRERRVGGQRVGDERVGGPLRRCRRRLRRGDAGGDEQRDGRDDGAPDPAAPDHAAPPLRAAARRAAMRS